jgi:hypothetical protein
MVAEAAGNLPGHRARPARAPSGSRSPLAILDPNEHEGSRPVASSVHSFNRCLDGVATKPTVKGAGLKPIDVPDRLAVGLHSNCIRIDWIVGFGDELNLSSKGRPDSELGGIVPISRYFGHELTWRSGALKRVYDRKAVAWETRTRVGQQSEIRKLELRTEPELGFVSFKIRSRSRWEPAEKSR